MSVPSLDDLDRLRVEVDAARAVLEEVEGRRRAAVVAAVRAGQAKLAVATAAGVTRQSVDRWTGVWQRTS